MPSVDIRSDTGGITYAANADLATLWDATSGTTTTTGDIAIFGVYVTSTYRNRELFVAFDTSTTNIPSGATINSVALSITIPSWGVYGDPNAFPVIEAFLYDWSASGLDSSDHRSHTALSGYYSSPGRMAYSGTGYVNQADPQTVTFTSESGFAGSLSSTTTYLVLAAEQARIASASWDTNHYFNVCLPSNATATNRPTLTVDYTEGGGTTYLVAGTVAASSATTGAVSVKRAAAGSIAAASATTGAANRKLAVAGTVAAQSAASGAVTRKLPVSAAVAATSATSGAVTVKRAVAGTVAAQSATTGDPDRAVAVSGTIAAMSAATGAVTVTLPTAGVRGTVSVTSATSGAVTVRRAVTGTVAATSAATGAVTRTLAVAGRVSVVSGTSGTVTGGLPPVIIGVRRLTAPARIRGLAAPARVRGLVAPVRRRYPH